MDVAVVAPKTVVHAFGPCTSRKMRYVGAPTSLHESVPLSSTLIAPLGGDRLPGADFGHGFEVVVVTDPESLALFGSKVADVALAVFVIDGGGGGEDCTM